MPEDVPELLLLDVPLELLEVPDDVPEDVPELLLLDVPLELLPGLLGSSGIVGKSGISTGLSETVPS